MCVKDKQHFVSQSYLRNFSPDLSGYLDQKDSLPFKIRKRLKSRMKIHYYDIEKNMLNYGKISSLARINHYLLPIVDDIVKKTENKLNLLQKIIKNGAEECLYQNNNQETLWEIANCLKAKSFVFRDFLEFCNSLRVGDILGSDMRKRGTITYTEKAAEFFQTVLFTNDIEILFSLISKAYHIKIPSANVNGTFHQLDRKKNLEKEIIDEWRDKFKLPIRTIIPNTVYPILIENNTDLPFITGDECIPEGEYFLANLNTKVRDHYFPISPDLAIRFLERKEFETHFPREIIDKYEIHKMNGLIYNCSQYYLFSNTEKPLRLTTLEPKEILNRHRIVLDGWRRQT